MTADAAPTTPLESAPVANQTPNGSTGSQTTPQVPESDSIETTETGEFDAAAVEAAFGLPAGTLADATDQASALEAVREFTDKALLAGLNFDPNADKVVTPKATDATTTIAEANKTSGGNAEIDALRAKVESLESKLTSQEKAEQARLEAELDRRFKERVDSWASPKYGVTGSRNYKQTKALNDLTQLVKTQVAGAESLKLPRTTIEILADRARLFDDETYPPAAPKKSSDALGTPGARKDGNGPNTGPANIHQALMANKG